MKFRRQYSFIDTIILVILFGGIFYAAWVYVRYYTHIKYIITSDCDFKIPYNEGWFLKVNKKGEWAVFKKGGSSPHSLIITGDKKTFSDSCHAKAALKEYLKAYHENVIDSERSRFPD